MSTFKLSQTDIDSTNPNDSIVDRKYPNPKVALNQTPSHIGVLKVDVISGSVYTQGNIITWYSFPHPYDYIPTVIGLFYSAQGDFTNGGILPYTNFGALGEVFLDADEHNVNVKFQSFDIFGGTPLPERHFFIRYYVFAEEARPQ